MECGEEIEIYHVDENQEDSWNNVPLIFWDTLIQLVQARPYLYTRNDTRYKDRGLVENAWDRIAEELNQCGFKTESSEDIDAEYAKAKWVSVRGKYLRERGESKKASGSGNDKDEQNRWVLYPYLDFLHNVVQTRKSKFPRKDSIESFHSPAEEKEVAISSDEEQVEQSPLVPGSETDHHPVEVVAATAGLQNATSSVSNAKFSVVKDPRTGMLMAKQNTTGILKNLVVSGPSKLPGPRPAAQSGVRIVVPSFTGQTSSHLLGQNLPNLTGQSGPRLIRQTVPRLSLQTGPRVPVAVGKQGTLPSESDDDSLPYEKKLPRSVPPKQSIGEIMAAKSNNDALPNCEVQKTKSVTGALAKGKMQKLSTTKANSARAYQQTDLVDPEVQSQTRAYADTAGTPVRKRSRDESVLSSNSSPSPSVGSTSSAYEKAFEKAAAYFDSKGTVDAAHHFGMLVADRMRVLPKRNQGKAQQKILEILNDLDNEENS